MQICKNTSRVRIPEGEGQKEVGFSVYPSLAGYNGPLQHLDSLYLHAEPEVTTQAHSVSFYIKVSNIG